MKFTIFTFFTTLSIVRCFPQEQKNPLATNPLPFPPPSPQPQQQTPSQDPVPSLTPLSPETLNSQPQQAPQSPSQSQVGEPLPPIQAPTTSDQQGIQPQNQQNQYPQQQPYQQPSTNFQTGQLPGNPFADVLQLITLPLQIMASVIQG